MQHSANVLSMIVVIRKSNNNKTQGYAISMKKVVCCITTLSLLLPGILIPGMPARADEIRIGMSTALTGPLREVGQDMQNGITAYFTRINQQGGINGDRIKLIVKDDGYEPKNTAPNIRSLIDDDGVIAIIGNVGTPTAIVTVPIVNEKKTLLYGALSGASVLRKDPPDRYVMNYRASYKEEAAAMVNGLLKMGIKPEEIAFFTQRDSYGDAGYKGAVEALEAIGFTKTNALAHGRYTRNTLNIEGALAELLDAEVEPRAVIMAGGYAPSAKFIRLARKEFSDLLFVNLSFVGSKALLNELGDEAEGVIVTQVVPDFNNESLPIVDEYLTDLINYRTELSPGFVSFEGYITARIMVEALRRITGEQSRETLLKAMYSIDKLDIGLGQKISYERGKTQAVHTIWPSIIRNGDFQSFDWRQAPLTISLKNTAPAEEEP